jgi:hypothetical protein
VEALPSPTRPARAVLRYNRQAKFCETHGKPGYRTRRKALRAAERQRSAGTPLAVYRCDACDRFHVTSDVDRARATRAKAAA